MIKRLFFAVLIFVVASCDSSDFSALDNEVVIELTLIADEPVPLARVSRLASSDRQDLPDNFAITFNDVAIPNAQVILSTGSTDLLLEPIETAPGIYSYLGPEHIIQAGARYELQVTVPGVETQITGVTNVPNSVTILSASRESGTYLSSEQLVMKVTPGRSAGQPQSNFTLVTEALDVRISTAVPTVIGFIEDDDNSSLETYRISGSPIITEGNFVKFPDGTIELIYPWIGVGFYGPNIIYVNSLDVNISSFIRSNEVQEGGGTFGPGVIPNAIQTLSGAHGLFGSVSRDTVRFTVLPPEGE